MERSRRVPGWRPGRSSAAVLMGHGLFRHVARRRAGLRRRPGPVPEGWGRVPPSLLRYSDEQTIAGTAAVFAAIERHGLSPRPIRGLGRGGRVAIPGSGEPGRRLAQLQGRGRVGHVAAPDPAFCPPFAIRDDQPGAGVAWTEPGGRRRAARRGRGVSGGPDLAVGRRRAGRVARLERLVSGAGTRSGWKCAPLPANAWPWPWRWSARGHRGAAGGSGPSSRRDGLATCDAPLDLAWLAERLESGESQIATDDRDRSSRAACASSWSTGRRTRDEATWTRLNLSGSPAWGPRPRSAASSRRSRRTCWPVGRVCRS